MWAVCKKELRQFFSSLTGYIAILVFLLLNGLLLFVFPDTDILAFGYATLDKFFELAPWVLLLLIPAITMRSLSDEFRMGTFEILQTKPLSRSQVVGGKYLASLLVAVIALLPTLIYFVSLTQLSAQGGMDTGGTFGSYTGLFFLAAVFTAIGICCSSFTNNAVVAFISAAFVCFIVYNGFTAVSRLPVFAAGADYYIEMLGIDFHYRSISRGVVDSRDILYFISVIFFFLILTERNLAKQRLSKRNYKWIGALGLLVLLNLLASQFHYRIDLTQEKRYTLSEPTKKLLGQLDDAVDIEIFLKGDLKAGAKKLAKSTRELLEEFGEYGKGKVEFRFTDPITELNDSDKTILFDSLQRMGIQPKTEVVQSKKGEEQTRRTIIPGAIVHYHNRSFPVDLLKGVSQSDEAGLYNNAEALLEYKFANAIDKVTQKELPLIGYVSGNGEPLDLRVYDLIQNTLKKDYAFKILPLDNDSIPLIPSIFKSLIIVKPTTKFTDREKLKLDQYVLHGGSLVWMIDNLYAEMDSLRMDKETIAYDRGLGLEDLFFKYGVRVNLELVQDLQCAGINIVVGMQGDKPQFSLLNWPYFPLLQGSLTHPISKNLDPVYSKFANPIDTVKSPGIRKTVLLQSSVNARVTGTPALISFETLKKAPDPALFNRGPIPVAFLLEGKFSSLFANRISSGMTDTLDRLYHSPFLAKGEKEGRVIVAGDADIAMNEVTPKGPLPLGMNKDIEYTFANQNFIENCLDYLVNPSGILETRSKDLTLRLLDPKKVEEDRPFWQFINIVLPVLLVIAGGWLYQLLRKRKYH